jgi:Fur family ferric uptake transcriptional regulator
MPLELSNDEKIEKSLRDNHLKITKTRVAVFNILLSSQKPLSHSEIMEKLDTEKTWDRVTIYRTLSEFEEKKIIKTLLSKERTTFFEIIDTLKEHAHITCEICGKMECLIDEMFHFAIKEAGDYQIRSVEILVKGICGNCK